MYLEYVKKITREGRQFHNSPPGANCLATPLSGYIFSLQSRRRTY